MERAGELTRSEQLQTPDPPRKTETESELHCRRPGSGKSLVRWILAAIGRQNGIFPFLRLCLFMFLGQRLI